MRTSLWSIVGALALSTSASPAKDVVGRWDLQVEPGGYPSWIGVFKDGSEYKVHFLWMAGGVSRDLDKAKVEGNTVSFRVHDRDWVGTADGDTLTGTMTDGKGNTNKFTGQRFEPPIDVSGIWKVNVEAQKGKDSALVLMQKGDQIMGTWKTKSELKVEQARLEGGVLHFRVPEGESRSEAGLVIDATVKGDVLEGTAVTKGYRRKLSATREREWGEAVELFNGKNLDGWKPLGEGKNNKWSVVDSVLSNADRGDNIVSAKKFKDFKIRVEFRVPKNSNSGVYLRGRYEIQVEDSYGKKPHGGMCGAMYSRLLPSENAAKPPGEWQTFDATLIGQYFTLKHNGVKVIDNQEIEGITGGALDSNEYEPGPIYLQGDHGPVEYRKITIWPAQEPRVTARN